MNTANANLAASVRQRLLNHGRQQGIEPNALLTRFAIERFLYRISRSSFADRVGRALRQGAGVLGGCGERTNVLSTDLRNAGGYS